MKKRIFAVIVIFLLLQSFVATYAQNEDIQFCVRAFEDRNGNSQIDPGEPPLTRGIGANLLDANGVIVQTALLDNSLTNAQGVICFTRLALGQYTMVVTSAEYRATKQENLTVNITADPQTQITFFEYGGQRYDMGQSSIVNDVSNSANELTDDDIERIGVAAIGAIIAMAGATFIGLCFYIVLWRSRRSRMNMPLTTPEAYYMRPQSDRRTTTGSMQAVRPRDSGEWRRGE